MTNEIDLIEQWLKGLKDSAPAISTAGANSGAVAAAKNGFKASTHSNTVYVDFRGRRAMTGIPEAMVDGMRDELERRGR